MYPLNASASYPREQWYVAGTSSEFGREIVARRIFDEPLVFYRTEGGEPVALFGLCPHRLMPFELGNLKGDDIVCGYHGFEFGPEGRCVSIPTSSGISAGCKVKSFALRERGPFVWIWMGKGEPDHSLLPDASDIGLADNSGTWRVDVGTTFHMKARIQLLVDNLLDLSHLAFVHANSVQGGGIALADPVISEVAGQLKVIRTLENVDCPPFDAFLLGGCEDKVWSELITDVYSPALINAGGPWTYASNPDGTRGDNLIKQNFIHLMTPASSTETHYFSAISRNTRLDDDELSGMLCKQNDTVRSEDVVALEAIEKVADEFGDPKKEISIKVDEGAIRMRRNLHKLIDAEIGSIAEQ